MKNFFVVLFLFVATVAMAQQSSLPSHEPTVAELKAEIAQLKQQLLQAQFNLIQCQAPAIQQEVQSTQSAVQAERKDKSTSQGKKLSAEKK
jgi:hypothetical protein